MASSPICPIVKGVLKLRPVMASSSILTELGAINQSCKTWTVRETTLDLHGVKCFDPKIEAPALLSNILKMIQQTTMASEHSSSGPALHEMTPVTISSGLVPNPPSSTPFVPPSRSDWDLLFQPMFDESLNPQPYVDLQAPEVIAPIPEVVAHEHAVSTGSPSSTTVDQDAPSPR
ncbi:hypothetical protein Tco_0437824 [Tanacetum coccineum]